MNENNSIQIERQSGKWIKICDDDGEFMWYRCSCCRKTNDFYSDFCPNCGVKIKTVE